MFQVISARLARLAHQFRAGQLARQQQAVAVYGWQVQRVGFGTYRYRDPRFDTLRARQAPRSPAPAGGGRNG
jgi:uncharacterized membrane protein YGL010W